MLGQRTSLTATVPSQGFSGSLTKYYYDPLYQLSRADYPNVAPLNGEVHQWTYDNIGNRLTNTVNASTQTYTYQKIGINPLNWQRLLSDGENSYTYDANGSTQTRSGPGGNFTFGWSQENAMSSILGPITVGYTYDYQGRRTLKNLGGPNPTYLYDGLNLIKEAGPTPADYVFGPGIDEPLAMSRGGQIYYYVPDGLNSTATLTDIGGSVQNTYLYDAWGVTRGQTEAIGNPFTYTAREKGEAGTLFFRARYLSPVIGRMLSEDPVGYEGGLNLYTYVGNSPATYIDPEGLKPFKICTVLEDTPVAWSKKSYEYSVPLPILPIKFRVKIRPVTRRRCRFLCQCDCPDPLYPFVEILRYYYDPAAVPACMFKIPEVMLEGKCP